MNINTFNDFLIIDGIPIDYEYEKYRDLSTAVLDAVQEKVGEVATKRESLVEDYLNGIKPHGISD